MLQEMLAARRLPPLRPREEMLEILLHEEYGTLPPAPDSLTFRVERNYIRDFCAGKATLAHYRARLTDGASEFSFTFASVMPNKSGKQPIFIMMINLM